MTDVEKYGVFALVFVMGVLGLIVFYEPDSGQGAATTGGQSVIIRSAADVSLAAGVSTQRAQGHGPSSGALSAGLVPASRPSGRASSGSGHAPAGRAHSYRVKAPIADGAGSFEFSEPPVRYPGERTSLGLAGVDGRTIHIVRKGETLSKIAKQYLGSGERWREIEILNPGLDPKKMRPGDEVIVAVASPAAGGPRTTVPTADPSRRSRPAQPETLASGQAAKAGQTYVVQKGDTLGQIAQQMLGTVKRVDDLFAANKGVLDSPHDLKPGMELSIP